MSGRTAGRYGGGGGGSSSNAATNAEGGANTGNDDEIERRRANRYDRRRSRSNSAERRRRGDRYSRLEPASSSGSSNVNMSSGNYMPPQAPPAAMYGVTPPAMGQGPVGGGGGGGGMSPDQLFHFLQGGGGSGPAGDGLLQHHGGGGNPQQIHEDVRNNQSVQDFIPTVPKSLLGLLRGGDDAGGNSNNNNSTAWNMGGGDAGFPDPNSAASGQPVNALMMLEAPKIAPEVMRRARECRRAHISGFPPDTTEEELAEFFRLLMPDIRRVKTQREVRELGLAAGDSEDDIRQIPANAQVEVDQLRNVQMKQAKSKAFAFIEVNMADLITEMVEECARDPERFMFYPPSRYGGVGEGRGYAITVRRPKDFEPLDGHDEGKVVMTGFHPSLPEDKLRAAMEQFGTLDKFDVKNGLAYAEFADAKAAQDCRTDLHGEVLGRKMVVVLPLYYWLICVCFSEGVDVTVEEDDPISGKFALTHDLFGVGGVLSSSNNRGGPGGGIGGGLEGNAYRFDGGNGSNAAASGGGVGGGLIVGSAPGGGGAADAGALVVGGSGADAVDPMKDLLAMALPLSEVINRLSVRYPHLRPLYGNTQVPIYATRVLALLNLFDEEELVLDGSYSELLADIEQEVEKYGRVEELIVPRREGRPKAPDVPKKEDFEEDENPAEAFAAAQEAYQAARQVFNVELGKFLDRQIHPIYGGFGRVFVVYETVDEAAEAQRHIAGKLFGNRTVVTSFVFEDLLKEEMDDEKEEEEGGGDAAVAGATDKDKDNHDADSHADDVVAQESKLEGEEEDGSPIANEEGGAANSPGNDADEKEKEGETGGTVEDLD